jgi:hypothetical protein
MLVSLTHSMDIAEISRDYIARKKNVWQLAFSCNPLPKGTPRQPFRFVESSSIPRRRTRVRNVLVRKVPTKVPTASPLYRKDN